MIVRRLNQMSGMAPGIQAMEKGLPWTIPGRQFRRRSLDRVTHLESIHTMIHSHNHEPTHHPDQKSPLVVPDAANILSGGCFDTNNWVFQIVWKHTRCMDTQELMEHFFYREDRGKYGEHHTSTRGVPEFDELDEGPGAKGRGSDNHRYQERGRRVRHRCLQGESDKCISKFIMDMAQAELHEIKEIIQRTHEKQKACIPTGSGERGRRHNGKAQATDTSKRLGKDDQLTAGLMSQYMAFILIARLHEDVKNAHDERDELYENLDRLSRDVQKVKSDQDGFQGETTSKQESVEAIDWRQRFEKSEAEKQDLEDEVVSLRQQLHQNRRGSMTPFMHSLPLPVPQTTAREGKIFAGMKGLPISPVLSQGVSESSPRKRKRCTLEPPTVAIHINGHHRLPMSPAPSFDGSPSPSFD